VEKIEYIYSKYGKIEGVIIPIELWREIRKKIFDPSVYRGMYKGLVEDLDKEIRELRKEWDRNI